MSNVKSIFIRTVCEQAGVKAVRITVPGLRGRWGWVRNIKLEKGERALERSRGHFGNEDAALAAAHTHYRLRSA